MYQNILFDPDGTLTDPGIGITNSMMYAIVVFSPGTVDKSYIVDINVGYMIHYK